MISNVQFLSRLNTLSQPEIGNVVKISRKSVNFSLFREDDSRTYDVRANAGDFIIGEVGRIDGDGQTLEVGSIT